MKSKGIKITHFMEEYGLDRRILYEGYEGKTRKATLIAIAYGLNMNVEELVDGTDAMDAWYC